MSENPHPLGTVARLLVIATQPHDSDARQAARRVLAKRRACGQPEVQTVFEWELDTRQLSLF